MSVGTELGRRVGALGCSTGRFSGRFIWVQKGSLSMFKTLVTVSILSGLFLSSAVQAQGWRAWNRQEVHPVSEGVWEVLNGIGSGPRDYWCAIGDFALRQLRTPVAQRIYIWKGLGPAETQSGRKSVQFSLTPPAGADTSHSYSVSMRRPGYNLRAVTAQHFCRDYYEDSIIFLPRN